MKFNNINFSYNPYKLKTVILFIIAIFIAILIICHVFHIIMKDEYKIQLPKCLHCGTECEFIVEYEIWTEDVHCVRYLCSNCKYDQSMGTKAEQHIIIDDKCCMCGYSNYNKDLSEGT